ncbi:Ger(x)C family spore germination C-terminal domain-containing protein [Paenibacillus spongiae]|uniref:Ger(X)C family spore germination C-terminal domain-containing protein n=1 Tax=Paenibacillus spongiae TaxID=2909671 RepID=A0ABY5SF43_9BACL|nr:Ger(x)C family spore germination C-terminal domain-containing protein [Paenibacillus spongiae]UVI31293.1 Ger(x)C family spore germination C-terminal domain-containing protein [Paenibacillus spongiae]
MRETAEQIKLERSLDRYVEQKAEGFICKLQAVKSDPIGLGLYARTKMSYTDSPAPAFMLKRM